MKLYTLALISLSMASFNTYASNLYECKFGLIDETYKLTAVNINPTDSEKLALLRHWNSLRKKPSPDSYTEKTDFDDNSMKETVNVVRAMNERDALIKTINKYSIKHEEIYLQLHNGKIIPYFSITEMYDGSIDSVLVKKNHIDYPQGMEHVVSIFAESSIKDAENIKLFKKKKRSALKFLKNLDKEQGGFSSQIERIKNEKSDGFIKELSATHSKLKSFIKCAVK